MNGQIIQTLGSVLLHFFWQGAALAALLFLALSLTRNAQVRYALGVMALVLMALCPVATFLFLGTPPATVANAGPDYAAVAPAISNMTVVLSSASPVTSFDLLNSLVWLWCSGVCLFGFRAFGGWLVLQRLRRTAHDALSPELLERCRRLQQRIAVHATVRYAYSEMVDAPAVLGWFRPTVLIPISSLAGLSVEQLEAIIAHELAHVRRYDALVNLFQIGVETVLFYHPAVWWANRVIRMERENCCDDIAVSVCGNASEYARALAMMSGASSRPTWAMAANGGALKARVGRLLGMQNMAHGIPRAGLAMLAVLCASCVVLAAGAFKQDVPSVPPAPPPPPSVAAQVPAPPQPPDPPTVESLVQEKVLRDLEQQLKSADKLRATLSEEQLRNLEGQVRQQEKIARDLAVQAQSDSPKLQVSADVLAALKLSRDQAARDQTQQKSDESKGPSYIDSLESVGLTKLSVDDLIALKIQGVTADYVRQMKAAGIEPSVHELIGLKVQGVTPEYIRDIRATGLKPSLRDIMGMKVQGVTPEFIKAMQSAGLGDLQIHDIMGAKIQGITPEFIEKVRSHGFKDLTLRQLIGLKMANVF